MRRIVLAASTLVVLLAGCGGSRPAFSGTVTRWYAVDDGRIAVVYRVHNDGRVPSRVGCILNAVTRPGDTTQKLSVSRPVDSGGTMVVVDSVPILDHAAFLVDRVTADNCDAARSDQRRIPVAQGVRRVRGIRASAR